MSTASKSTTSTGTNTPKSLVFTTSPPTYVYQNSVFEATISLLDENKSTVIGVAKALEFTLRYHDTYDVVADQSVLLNASEHLPMIDADTGVCELKLYVKALTLSMEGRPFCIVVRATEAGVESAFSTPITSVKEKLRIVEQPPDVWFKDEGGREKCMTISLVLDPAPGRRLEDRVIPLQVRLLYENGNEVANQNILRLFPDMRPNMMNGRVTISFRIDDVSKNHQGQSFSVEIAPQRQDTSSMFQDISPIITNVIAIRSKRNKRKLNTPRGSVAGTPRHNGSTTMATSPMSSPTQRPRLMQNISIPGIPNMSMGATKQYVMTPQPGRSWNGQVASLQLGRINNIHWKLVGFEIFPDGSQNVSRPIYRCTSCRRFTDADSINTNPEHNAQCPSLVMLSASNNQFLQHTRHQQLQMQSMMSPQTPYQQQQHTPISQSMAAPSSSPSQQQQHTPDSPQQHQPQVELNSSPSKLSLEPPSNSYRQALTISPYMNKTNTEDPTTNMNGHMGNNGGDNTNSGGNNSAANLFRSQLDFDISNDFGSNSSTDNFSLDTSSASCLPNTTEDSVFYILARMYTNLQNQKLGLPAFDELQRMIGFYAESQNEAQTEVVFIPLGNVLLSEKEKEQITQRFNEELHTDSEAIHSLPKHQGNLIILREDALMHYWSQSITITGLE